MTFRTSLKPAFLTALLALGIGAAPKAADAGAEPFIGEIMLVGYSFCPRGWADAAGQLLPIANNSALYSLYGTTYGGDGRTTFGLPDLRGRVAMGQGRGPGLPEARLGQRVGQAAATLAEVNMPAHNHGVTVAMNAAPTPGNSPAPAGALPAISSVGTIYAPSTSTVPMAANATSVTQSDRGGGQAFDIHQPSLVLRYCVALQGIYPSRN